jgi:PhnB protein
MEMGHQRNNAGATGKYTKNGTPNWYTAITPFIVVSNPAEAIKFYETVFGAKTKSVTDFGEDGNKMIIHADIDFGNGYLQLGAANPAYQLVLPPGGDKACYSLAIYVPDVDQTSALAVANGATVREPLTNFVSGDRYCSILDPFGIRWSIMTRIEDISEEESYRRVYEWSKSLGG